MHVVFTLSFNTRYFYLSMSLFIGHLLVFRSLFGILSDAHQHDTRQARKGDIYMTYHNTLQYGERSNRYAGAKSWNNSFEH